MTVTALAPPISLRRPSLSRTHLLVSAAATLAATLGLFAATPLAGEADFIVFFVVTFIGVQTVASYAVEGGRAARNRLAITLLISAVGLAMLPLLAVLIYTIERGARTISLHFLTHTMQRVGPLDANGGALHAIVGTIEQVGLASLISIPVGLLAAIYIVEYGRGRFAFWVRFFVDVMTGLPSIVAGLFVYAFFVIGLHQGFSGFAAGMALSVLMLPVVVRASEEMLKLVPNDLREASYGLGIPRWRTIVSVVVPTASSGLTTGVMLAIARVTGETAPLLLTTFGFDAMRVNAFKGPQSALPLYVFQQAGSAFDVAVNRAWAGALTLIAIVLLLTVAARLLTRRNRLAN